MIFRGRDADGELQWVKSSYSTNEGPECVEIASAVDTIRVRDSKIAQGPQLSFPAASWSALIGHTAAAS